MNGTMITAERRGKRIVRNSSFFKKVPSAAIPSSNNRTAPASSASTGRETASGPCTLIFSCPLQFAGASGELPILRFQYQVRCRHKLIQLRNLQVFPFLTQLSQRRTQFPYFPVSVLLPMRLWPIYHSSFHQTSDQIVITYGKDLRCFPRTGVPRWWKNDHFKKPLFS